METWAAAAAAGEGKAAPWEGRDPALVPPPPRGTRRASSGVWASKSPTGCWLCAGLVFLRYSPVAAQRGAEAGRQIAGTHRLVITMAAVDRFYLLYREISRSCSFYIEALAIVGAWYTVRKCVSLAFDTYSMLRLHVVPKLGSEIDLVKQYGKWAVVTGSTDGIGKAYAEQLAKRGVNIILISRNKEKLEAVSRSISETYKVETDFIVADFSKGREPYPAIKEALKDREIGILVNNVGIFYPYPDYFTNVSEDFLWDTININIASANMMIHIVLPGMVEKRRGAIVNVSSASCCQPTPMLTIYGASKTYLDYFSRALHYEYASKGIFVQSLTPFIIATKMVACSSTASKRSFFFPSAEEYASHAISTLGLSTRTTGYWKHAIKFTLGERLPEWIWAWFAQYFGRIIRKEALTRKVK